jgi:putative protease
MKKPELLVPVGNLEAFFAALDAGADAIYLGGKEFGARQRAKNFSLFELERLVPYAHRHGVEIYVTVNTLLKEREIASLYRFLNELQDLGVDAVIVQDPGVIHIVRRDFPRLPVHVSTQLSIHNANGVQAAAGLGCKRVVLARELSLAEISAVSRQTETELEVFVFGALCLSIAGQCQLSSFLGGQSGNRGRCTQPCRRLYTQGSRSGYYLSPSDYNALEFLPQLMDMDITSCKIEGRLKSSQYVGQVTSAFRQAIDLIARDGDLEAEKLRELNGQLQSVYSRPLTSANLSGTYPHSIIQLNQHGSMGIKIGTVVVVNGHSVRVRISRNLSPGDRIKVVSRQSDGRKNAFTVKEVRPVPEKGHKPQGNFTEAWLEVPVPCRQGDVLVKVGSKDYYSSRGSKYWLEKLKREVEPPARRRKKVIHYVPARLTAPLPSGMTVAETASALLPWQLKVSSWENFQRFSRERGYNLVVELNRQIMHRLAGHEREVFQRHPRLIWSLPAIHFPGSKQRLAGRVKRLLNAGFRRFQLNNLGQVQLFERQYKQELMLTTGIHLPATNLAAVIAYQSMGFSTVLLSPEMDRESMEMVCKRTPAEVKLALLIFAFMPLLPTRMPLPVTRKKVPLISPHGEQLFPFFRDGLTYLIPGQPFSLTDNLSRLPGADMMTKVIDFSFYPPGFIPASLLAKIRHGKLIPQRTLYNYSRKWD